ncbi:MAG: methyltransferase domain-containing protein, partial [Pseudomonadota bacterium]|nr:methyltransferase domain-containing protein [Pseudomonadota bacterium]
MGKCFRSRDQWFQTPLGQRLLAAEVSTLQQILPQLFGYHLLQISAIGNGQLLESSRITHRCILTHSPDYPLHHYYSHVCALAEILPFSQDSLDVVILPHILEFEDNPHKVLREIQRILIPEGHVVLLGFNPFSLWGIYHL